MNNLYSVTITEANAHGKPQKGPRTVLRFIAATEESAEGFGEALAVDLTSRTESPHTHHVEPLPYLRSGPAGEGDKLELIGMARREAGL